MNYELGPGNNPNIDELARLQYAEASDNTSNLNLRWRAYNHIPGGDRFIRQLLHEMFILTPNSVADIGCNDGTNLVLLRDEGHEGLALGVDIDSRIFSDTSPILFEEDLSPLSLLVGEAQHIPLADNSVDSVLALFMLYHVPDPELGIEEMYRVLKPGGTLGITTSGPMNKLKHREFERRIAEYLGIEPPEVFSQRFDSAQLESMYSEWIGDIDVPDGATEAQIAILLMEWITERRGKPSDNPRFSHMQVSRQNEVMVFDRSNIGVYLDSLRSMRSAFRPARLEVEDQAWDEAIREVVLPVIFHEMDTRAGYFEDTVERSYLVAVKRNNAPGPRMSMHEYLVEEELLEEKQISIESALFYAKDMAFPCTKEELCAHIVERQNGLTRAWLSEVLMQDVYDERQIYIDIDRGKDTRLVEEDFCAWEHDTRSWKLLKYKASDLTYPQKKESAIEWVTEKVGFSKDFLLKYLSGATFNSLDDLRQAMRTMYNLDELETLYPKRLKFVTEFSALERDWMSE